jgi:HK97 family phage major capsid protein
VAEPTVPTTQDELAEALAAIETSDPTARATEMAELMAAYTAGQRANDPDIEVQVKAQVEAVFSEMMKKGGFTPERPPVGAAAKDKVSSDVRVYNRHAVGTKADGIFEDGGDFLKAVWDAGPSRGGYQASPHASQLDKLQEIRAAYSTTVPAEGGFLVPEELRSEIMTTMLETALIRPRARVIPMSTQTTEFPHVAGENHTSSIHGGIIGYWTKEAGQLIVSEAKFGSIKLEARKLTTYAELPAELTADAPGFQGFFNQAYPEAIAWFEDIAFIDGDGTDQPVGFRHSTSPIVTVAKEATQAADTIVYANVAKMWARLLPGSHGSAVWLANIDTFPTMSQMELSSGSAAVWQDTISGTPVQRLLGAPIVYTEKLPTVGDLGDICLVDLRHYLIGDRQAMQTAASADFKFQTDELAFRVIQRVDGRPDMVNAVTPRKGAGTLSPFVQLAART